MDKNIIREDMEDIFGRDIPWEQLRGSTVLITGAYGMLASYMTYMLIYLNEEHNMGIKIIALVRSEEKFRARFGEYADRDYISVRTDPLDCPVDIKENIGYIIHAASLASPQHYGVRPIEVLKPNAIGTYYLLELAERKNIKGFLLFSTGDVYGHVTGVPSVTETDYGVMDTLDIHSCYGESKRMAETMCKAYFHQKNVPVKIARIWHTYAPTMDIQNDPRVFCSFVKDILEDKDIVIKSDGRSKRSFCYIADAAAAYFLILLKGGGAEAYNVCNTKEFYSISELAEILTAIYPQKGLKAIYKKRPENENYIENNLVDFIPPDNSKLTALGWQPVYSAAEGFKRVIDCLSGNKT